MQNINNLFSKLLTSTPICDKAVIIPFATSNKVFNEIEETKIFTFNRHIKHNK